MKQDGLQRMFDFLDLLRAKEIKFRLERQSPDALMVTFTTANRCIEACFLEDEVWFSIFTERAVTESPEMGIRRIIAEKWDD